MHGFSRSAIAQIMDRFLAVFQMYKRIGYVDLLQGALDRHRIHLIVFYQENGFVGDFHVSFPLVVFAISSVWGRVK